MAIDIAFIGGFLACFVPCMAVAWRAFTDSECDNNAETEKAALLTELRSTPEHLAAFGW